ncbi:MAG: WYL domain-containing protein [Alphaproteobacteria bacterium]|nr:WYL domain-containing protein [Alphaproteobacteria bacterium]
MAYEKAHDLLDLAIWMQSGRDGVSLKDIQQRFNVSRRTAERMRDMILERFPQAELAPNGENNTKHWYIPQGTLKDFIQYSPEELAVLEISKKLLLKQNMSSQAQVLDGTINKIKASIKPDVLRLIGTDAEAMAESSIFVYRPGPKLKIDSNILKTIQNAIVSLKRIKIDYFYGHNQKTNFAILDPYGFLFGERNQYLVAHHSDGYYGDEVHLFMLNNIKKVEILPDPLKVVPGFNLQSYAAQSFGVYQEEPFEVEWLFDKEVAGEAAKYIFHPSQTVKYNTDGTLTVKFKAGGAREMDWHLYTWGNHVKVIKPKDWNKRKKHD